MMSVVKSFWAWVRREPVRFAAGVIAVASVVGVTVTDVQVEAAIAAVAAVIGLLEAVRAGVSPVASGDAAQPL